MSEILAAPKLYKRAAAWLILDCGHWYKWTGPSVPKPGTEFDCVACKPPIQVVKPQS